MADARSPPAIDIEKTSLDPSSVFGAPEDILRNQAIASDQKVEILRR
jgi:hypothetical protein